MSEIEKDRAATKAIILLERAADFLESAGMDTSAEHIDFVTEDVRAERTLKNLNGAIMEVKK